ncbi:MAG: phosphoglycolate phosphatase [Gammaproteobacteria bacterium]|nr:MAG: phosphoglycolate phosphatase [Gammaproteobacteria bacterium]
MLDETPSAVLFDLDGTLIDTAPDFVYIVNKLLGQENKPPLPDAEIRNCVSNGARALITLAFDLPIEHPDFEPLKKRLLDLYDQHIAVASQLFEGMEACLNLMEANNIPWGIVTNKPSRFTDPLLDRLGLAQRSAVTICPDHVKNTKPDPEPLFKACQRINVEPAQCIYVGDHVRDIEAGNRADMTTITALYGYIGHNEDPLTWQADHAVETTQDLIKLLTPVISH